MSKIWVTRKELNEIIQDAFRCDACSTAHKECDCHVEESAEVNPWAICAAKNEQGSDKYENCVQSIKRKGVR